MKTTTRKGLLGTKLGMTQMWDENNKIVPVTVIAADSNVITQVKTSDSSNGYNAVQVGYGGRVFNYYPELRRAMPGTFLGEDAREVIDNKTGATRVEYR